MAEIRDTLKEVNSLRQQAEDWNDKARQAAEEAKSADPETRKKLMQQAHFYASESDKLFETAKRLLANA